jgi:hypothetical protein
VSVTILSVEEKLGVGKAIRHHILKRILLILYDFWVKNSSWKNNQETITLLEEWKNDV